MQEPLVGLLQELATCKRHLLSYDGLLAVSRLVTCLRIEDQLHQMTELCPVLTGWRRSVRNFRNGLGILDRRIVVGAMHDDHVQSRDDENVMSPVSPRRIDSGKRDLN